MDDAIAIVGAARTPMGRYRGELRAWQAPDLGAAAIGAATTGAGLAPDQVDECLMGCVLPAGQGQAPARQAALGAGLPLAVRCTTVNKMCGSGMKAVVLAADQLRAGDGRVAVAGGMESMTNAPFLVWRNPATGKPDPDRPQADHMFLDGLEDAYDPGRLMGTYAEDCAGLYQFTREAQDRYALESLDNARAAGAEGRLDAEIVPLASIPGSGSVEMGSDELPRSVDPKRVPSLKPVFRDGGTVTAANSSAVSDGAAALVLARAAELASLGLTARAVIRAHASHAQEPALFTSAPVPAIRTALERAGWSVGEVDLWEINEAFAVVPMVAMTELGIPRERLNVNGGACALGHPIGASGARILVTLLHALEARGAMRGMAAICIGGGEAMAVAVERV